jgi:hypothetical protein
LQPLRYVLLGQQTQICDFDNGPEEIKEVGRERYLEHGVV